MDSQALDSYLKLVEEPIAGADPCGEYLKSDDDLTLLRDEVKGKLGTPQAGEIQWDLAADIGVRILTERSKDVVVATYTVLALFRTSRYKGLEIGLGMLRVLAEKWWESCHPPARRMRARTGALEWCMERLEDEINGDPPRPAERESVQKCLDELEEMRAHLKTHLGPEAPSNRRAREALETQLSQLPEPKPKAPPPPPSPPPKAPQQESPPPTLAGGPAPEAQAAEATPAPAPAPAARAAAPAPQATPAPPVVIPDPPAAMGETPAEVLKDLRRVFSGLQQASVALRAARPLDPLPYRLSRIAAWTLLSDAPPSKDGATVIPDPPKAELQHFEALAAAESWAELLGKAETRFGTLPLWLDLQHFVVRGLKAMGPPAAPARITVEGWVRDLLLRIPGLMDLSFRQGTPFASEATRRWLEGEILAAPSGPSSAGGGGGGGGEGEGLTELRAALSGVGRVEDLGPVQGQVEALPREVDRFRGRLLLAEACLRLDRPDHASLILDRLYEIARRHSLGAWDPSLQAELIELMIRARQRGSEGVAGDASTMGSLIAELCNLDIGRALRFRYPS